MLLQRLQQHVGKFSPVVPFDPQTDRAIALDLSDKNEELTAEIFSDTKSFDQYIQSLLQAGDARFGYGGYLENRAVYGRSRLFNSGKDAAQPRTLHLGLDIWGAAGTEVMAPLDGTIHSIGYHPAYGNYGATIILQHHLEGVLFYTLYGHLSKADLTCKSGDAVKGGSVFAHFGKYEENGQWPPHLHFQVIHQFNGQRGDYPGVCSFAETAFYKNNCPDPMLMVTFN